MLDGAGEANGQIFFIYDHISNPDLLEAEGYTIGIEDGMGTRGMTYAYAPCCGDWSTPQGNPPANGTTLQLQPTLIHPDADYSRTFRYTARVDAELNETIISTIIGNSNSADPTMNNFWSTHYLYVREQTYLPIVGQ